MKGSSVWRILLHLVTEDRDLFFFLLGFFALVVAISLRERDMAGIIGLVFFAAGCIFYLNKYRKTAANILARKHVPIVVVTGKDARYARGLLEEAKDAITRVTGFKDFKGLEDLSRVNLEHDAIVRLDGNLKCSDLAQWNTLVNRVQETARRLADDIGGDIVYHLFIFGVAITALAMGLGAVFGTRPKVIVYQSFGGSNWQPVFDLSEDPRKVKQIHEYDSYKYFDCIWPEVSAPQMAIVLNMASHETTSYVHNYLRDASIGDIAIVTINNKYQGHFTEANWLPVMQELYSVYSRVHREGPSQIHMFLNIPTALAFGLGVAIGNYNQVAVYCWDGKSYSPVLWLNELESVM